MEMSDKSAFRLMLMEVGELYSKMITKSLINVYWQALKLFDWQDVKKALQAHIQNPDMGQYFPKPTDVVRFIEGSPETKALQAWAIVERAIEQVGIYQSVAFDDLITHAVLDEMGGWIKLCSLTTKELSFSARDFQKRYRGYVHKAPERYPQYFYGLFECDNTKNGYPIDAPILIGDFDKAKKVMQQGADTFLLLYQDGIIQNSRPRLHLSKPEESNDE
jgi:hypothetical protein